MRLDLGGGTINTKAPGHLNIDICQGADINWDLNNGLPLKRKLPREYSGIDTREVDKRIARDKATYILEPNSIEGIRANQLIEHLNTIIPLMNDCFEVLKPGGLLEISTPLAGTDPFWQDPTHKKGYIRRSFDYFCDDISTADAREEYGITCKFKVVWELLEHGWNFQIKLQKPDEGLPEKL